MPLCGVKGLVVLGALKFTFEDICPTISADKCLRSHTTIFARVHQQFHRSMFVTLSFDVLILGV